MRDRHGVAVQTRAGLSAILEDASRRGELIILIGHSLGSVIAYDTLWELSRTSQVQVKLLLTLGSPLTAEREER